MSSPSPATSSSPHNVLPPSSINISSVTGANYLSSLSSDADDTDSDHSVTLAPRPRLDARRASGTNIVHRDHPDIEIRSEVFPPNDARAMSPRRSSLEIEKLGEDARRSLQSHAKTLQSGLNALAEKIEMVKSDHERLEKQNLALQDYIGGLTRSMSKTDLTSKSKK